MPVDLQLYIPTGVAGYFGDKIHNASIREIGDTCDSHPYTDKNRKKIGIFLTKNTVEKLPFYPGIHQIGRSEQNREEETQKG